jgi:hypothetical protein
MIGAFRIRKDCGEDLLSILQLHDSSAVDVPGAAVESV